MGDGYVGPTILTNKRFELSTLLVAQANHSN